MTPRADAIRSPARRWRDAGQWHSVPAFAKVNLGLEVLGLRQDGYHELRTLFQTIALCDELLMKRSSDGSVRVSCDHPQVPTGADNLVHRAAMELRRFAGVEAGVEIDMRKAIPVAAGLGGGSSDAAAALVGLDGLWGLHLGVAGLYPLARRLGADVPYFLVGGTALGLGRGDEVYPLERQVRAHIVLVDLEHPVSTAAVFERIDARLTARENSNRIFRFILRDLAGDVSAMRHLANDLEEAALEEAPRLAGPMRRARRLLSDGGAKLASLSGSGATYFGVFDRHEEARRSAASLRGAGFRAIVTKTLTRAQYRRAWAERLGRKRVPAQLEVPSPWKSQTSK